LTFFVDANVPIYAAAGSGEQGEACSKVMRAVAAGADGRASTAVLEEVWHVELARLAGSADGLAARALAVFSPLLTVTEEVIRAALDLEAPALGANDRIHVATSVANGIETIVSADAGFDSLAPVRRVDPLDGDALAALLRLT
jgi:predicted nucleic acid-binding protein